MKKEYIKPIIIHIKTWNDEALLQTASLYNINEVDPDENIAGEGGEDGPETGDGGYIWND
mgnify:FL=1|nr:hypothetical protein [Prevotella sp.]